MNNPKLTYQSSHLFSHLDCRDSAIDCGANVGLFTKVLAERGVCTYAFEPNPHAYAVLVEKFRNHPNVYCFQKGVFTRDDTMKLYLHEFSHTDPLKYSTGSSMLESKGNVLKDTFVEVEVIDLDAFIRKLGKKISLLKMDVEGMEIAILNKLIDTGMINQIDLVLCETHDAKIPELRESTSRLKQRLVDLNIKHVNLEWI